MADLWDTNPDNVFSPPDEQPSPAPSGQDDASGQDDHTNEVQLRNERGRLRLPAYVLIALGIALAAALLVIIGVMIAPG